MWYIKARGGGEGGLLALLQRQRPLCICPSLEDLGYNTQHTQHQEGGLAARPSI
jgi:hypothetical protein